MNIKKNIIALTVAGAFAAPVAAMAADALSSVTIYGQMNASIDSIEDDNGTPAANNTPAAIAAATSTFKTTKNNLSSTETRIGLKGSEDMGGGLTGLWQIESQVNLDNDGGGLDGGGLNNNRNGTTGGTRIGERNTFVGIRSAEMGTILAGRHDTPYKMSTRMLDPFIFTIADNRSIMGNTIHDDILGNVVAYISPTINNLSFAAATVFGSEMRGQVPDPLFNKKSNTVSLAGKFTMGGIYGTVAYQSIKFGTADGTFNTADTFPALPDLDKATAMKIGGSYSMDTPNMPIKVSAVYEQLKTTTAAVVATTFKNSNLYFAGELGVTGAVKVKAAYTMGFKTDVNGVELANSGRNQATVGADYGLSARTTVYAQYTKLENDAVVIFQAMLGPQSTGASTGMAPSAFSVGVKHMF
ncbi:MAG: porin [Candidatus Nitrotoga sp.]